MFHHFGCFTLIAFAFSVNNHRTLKQGCRYTRQGGIYQYIYKPHVQNLFLHTNNHPRLLKWNLDTYLNQSLLGQQCLQKWVCMWYQEHQLNRSGMSGTCISKLQGNLDSRHIYKHGHMFFHSPPKEFVKVCVWQPQGGCLFFPLRKGVGRGKRGGELNTFT